MDTRANFVERRDRPRAGSIAQLEDITYSVLRKQGVVREPNRQTPKLRMASETDCLNVRLIVLP